MKQSEIDFFIRVCELCRGVDLKGQIQGAMTPRDLINLPNFPIHHKQAWYYLEKWADKGWYNYGVTVDLGWIEKGWWKL